MLLSLMGFARHVPARTVLVAVAAAVVVMVGVLAAAGYLTQRPASSAAALACAPRPCADLEGYTAWVSDVQTANGVVSMQVSFRNASTSTHAEPLDFSLVDAGRSYAPVFDAPGCARWPRTAFHDGARFGPVPLCFRPDRTAAPLKLHWSPDMGFFCCDTEIAL